jgi:hypothetical protein
MNAVVIPVRTMGLVSTEVDFTNVAVIQDGQEQIVP